MALKKSELYSSQWASCNTEEHRIWLNLELAKKSLGALEYIIVHELCHFLERHHNERYVTYLDRYMPNWRAVRKELNRVV